MKKSYLTNVCYITHDLYQVYGSEFHFFDIIINNYFENYKK